MNKSSIQKKDPEDQESNQEKDCALCFTVKDKSILFSTSAPKCYLFVSECSFFFMLDFINCEICVEEICVKKIIPSVMFMW